MTSAELVELVKSGPTDKLVAALAPLSESERKKLSKTALGLLKESTPNDVGPFFHQGRSTLLRAKLAVLGVGPLGDAQRIRLWHLVNSWQDKHDYREPVFQILRDRKPDWLAKWVDKELELKETYPDWNLIRRLIREGVCPKPQSEAYTLKLLLGSFRYCNRDKTLKDNLLDDPDLLGDEIWRIFDLAPTRGTILMGTDITDVVADGKEGLKASHSWGHVLRDLSQEGKLDRQRLLSASLGGILRNTEARNTVWFCKFYELLEPTSDERLCLQDTYLQLLSHPVPAVVDLALHALGVLGKSKQLDVGRLIGGIGPVFHLPPKAQPLGAVRFLARLIGANANHLPKLAEVLINGLSHPAVPVQEAIIELLQKVRDQVADVIAGTLPAQLEFVAPSLQERARKLLVDETSVPSVAASLSPTFDLIEQARQIPSPWREMAGIDSLLRAIEGTGEIATVAFDPLAVPRLYADQRVQPIGTLDELIERLTVAVEGLDDAIEFELLVDGLSRLCDQRPEDFEARVAPLLLRIEKLLPSHQSIPLTMTAGGLRMALFKLVLRWCNREVRDTREERDSIFGFLDVRLGILAARIRNRQAAPLLACPTHRQGWIDPREMATRLETYQQLGQEPAKHDFIQGLLRLAPDARIETLTRVAKLQGKYAAAFRYALGGPLRETLLPAAVLIAADRARTPFAELTEIQALADVEGPDASKPAKYTWHVTPFASLTIEVEPAIRPSELARNLPCVLLQQWRVKNDFAWAAGNQGLNRWLGTAWPANLESFFAAGVCIHAGQFPEAFFLRQRATFLEPLFDADSRFSEMAQILIALSLTEELAEVTGLAVDALVELIRDGRCIGTELGAVLGRMLPCNFIKLNRLGKQLETAARASLLHAHVCGQIVQTACTQLPEARKDLHHLLGPLLEWLSALEQGIVEDLRPMLEKLTSGKTGALARKLLALRGNPSKRTSLLLEALQGRVERARRWADGERFTQSS